MSDKRAGLGSKVLDEARFLKSWASNPLRTGAVSPSGPKLAARMASYLTPKPGEPVVELGPGTGVVTKAIFDRGVSHKDLVTVEYCNEFCRLLQSRYPGLNVVEGDAYALKTTLAGTRFAEPGSLTGIVSSLPLFSRPEPARRALIVEALELLKPGAPYIQFSYALKPPVPAEMGHFTVSRSEWIWMNLPPARVWIYRKPHA